MGLDEFYQFISGIGGVAITIGVFYGTFKNKIKVLEDAQKHDSKKFEKVWDELKDKASETMVNEYKADIIREIDGLKSYMRDLLINNK